MKTVLTDYEGFALASEFMRPTLETYDPSSNGGGEFGAYGFMHNYDRKAGEEPGDVYDFPFEGHTTFHDRVRRTYPQWLDDLAALKGIEVDPDLRDATAQWLSYLVFYRPIDERMGQS